MQPPPDNAVTLPSEPEGDHFENLVAALFSLGGYFVEKNITEKVASRQIQELDVVASQWVDNRPLRILAEAKSGGWETKDLFALLGRIKYLELDHGYLFHRDTSGDPHENQLPVDRFRKHGISAHSVSPTKPIDWERLGDLLKVAPSAILERETHTHALSAWRYSFWVEKILVQQLVHYTKSLGDRKGAFWEARRILDEINKRFFYLDCRQQSESLYDTYFPFQHLTKRAIQEKLQRDPGNELKGLDESHAFAACV